MQRAAIDVCITADIEFNINYALVAPYRRKPTGLASVLRPVGGRSHGLGFILQTLARFGVPATFFVEVFNACHFGIDEMGDAVRMIQAEGQDVQLHIHPCWRFFAEPDFPANLKGRWPYDKITGCSVTELSALLTHAVSLFEQMAGTKPVALRTGSLQSERNLYPAMAQTGIHLSSSIGLGFNPPEDPVLRLPGGIHLFDGVFEVPVTSYCDWRLGARQHLKVLTIVGSSWPEIRTVLDRAWLEQAGPVVVLTHASEFSQDVDNGGEHHDYRAALVAQRRLEQLCSHLAMHRDRFNPLTFRSGAANWLTSPPRTAPLLSGSILGAARRLFENTLMERRK